MSPLRLGNNSVASLIPDWPKRDRRRVCYESPGQSWDTPDQENVVATM